MNYAFVSESTVNSLIKRTPGAFWEGWDLVLWRPTPDGYTSERGRFRGGKWGIESRFKMRDDGSWKVPARIV